MSLWSKLRTLFRKNSLEADMAEEMRSHLEMQIERNVAAGMSPEEARYAARRQFGHVDGIKEAARDQRGWLWLEQIWQDLIYGVRSLGKHPGFTTVALLTLGLGIGVNALILSTINDLILRPARRDRQQSLVALHTMRVGADRNYRPFNYAEFTTLRAAKDIFSDVAAMQFGINLVGEDDNVQRRLLCLVSQNYFSLLGVHPLRGRFFSDEEADPAASIPVAVASYDLWQRQGGREDFVGSQIKIDGRNHTVIGIAPAGFGGLHWSSGPDAWLPFGLAANMTAMWGIRPPGSRLLDPHAYMLELFGDLRPGLTLAAANARLAPLSARLNELNGVSAAESRALSLTLPPRANLDITFPADESDLPTYAALAMGMTITVLLVACLNVANMLFGRGIARRRDIAIRLSLGASRWRVVRQLLVEGLLLALAGGVVGLLLASWSNSYLLDLTSRHSGWIGLHLRPTFDWPLLAGTFALCLFATVLVSLAPALRATRLNLVDDLKSQTGELVKTGRWNRFFSFRHCLIMSQITLSLVLLFSASLLVHAVANSERDRGFDTNGRLIANLDYYLARTPSREVPLRQRALLAHAATMPGVESAALASSVPFNFESNHRPVFSIEGAGRKSEFGIDALFTVVSHGYFTTMGIPLLRGRDFTEAEGLQSSGGSRVIIIDDSLGRALFGDEDPIGRHLALSKNEADGQHGAREFEIIGIVRSPREDAFQPVRPYARFYRPAGQMPGGIIDTYLHLKLKPSVAQTAMIDTLRRELRALDPQTPVLACLPLEDFIGQNLNVWSMRLIVILFSIFGLIALILAVVGVYGVKSYIVACRTQEIGVRIAIGARTADVLSLLLKQSVLQIALGVIAGLVLAVIAGQFLARILYRISPTDPFALICASGVLAVVSILACLVPALRAARINPIVALRAE